MDRTMSDRGARAFAHFETLQQHICDRLAAADESGAFSIDDWTFEGGGGGRTRVLENGQFIEKGAVNVSCVHGEMSEAMKGQMPGNGQRFFATGLSLIVHPRSPHAPTVHANFRYLETSEGDRSTAWYGGGADLTPWILYDGDAVDFHEVWRGVCARHPVIDHARLKRWCDEYFLIKHRGERRGIGGIFFDHLGLPDPEIGAPADLDAAEQFVIDASRAFLSAYVPVLDRRKSTLGTDSERQWQLLRRGRYVEFNLIYDRGTTFGLRSGGRVESILASLPSAAAWAYDHKPEPGYQQRLVEVLENPRDWAR